MKDSGRISTTNFIREVNSLILIIVFVSITNFLAWEVRKVKIYRPIFWVAITASSLPEFKFYSRLYFFSFYYFDVFIILLYINYPVTKFFRTMNAVMRFCFFYVIMNFEI